VEWTRLYASLPNLPRVQAAEDSDGAAWLLVQSICYCTHAESDGFIPDTQVPRFGGVRLRQRVAALAREGLWIRAGKGYTLDPDIWSEERNLSDSAEKKRSADRERQRTKRAAAKAAQNGSVQSRDSRATVGATHPATGSRDSRTPDKRREYKPPPTPPGDMRPLWPTAVADVPEEGDQDQPETPDRTALVAEIRSARPDWSTGSINRALSDPSVAERPWTLVQAALRTVAADPESRAPGRLAHDGPWWHQQGATAQAGPRPDWCGECEREDHRWTDTSDGPMPCGNCSPQASRRAS
jgi:hypothetical protein